MRKIMIKNKLRFQENIQMRKIMIKNKLRFHKSKITQTLNCNIKNQILVMPMVKHNTFYLIIVYILIF